MKDLEFKRPKSHYLRHAVEVNPNVPPEALNFRMKILSSHKSAFERQIAEAVLIHKYLGPMLLNSKSEYNRCKIPRIVMKLGDDEPEEDPDKKSEREAIERIRLLYPEKNRKREAKCSEAVRTTVSKVVKRS